MHISNEINWWRTTNDLDSPSHWSLIDDWVKYELDENLTDADRNDLGEAVGAILSVIRRNK